MAEKRVVHELPELTGEFPELPEIPNGKTLIPFSSPLRRAEKECVLGYIATVAIRNNGWKPVSTHEFVGIIREGAWKVNPQGVINAVWTMADDGLLEIVRYEPEQTEFIVPTAELAQMITQSQLRYV